jgi:hypothetical protein
LWEHSGQSLALLVAAVKTKPQPQQQTDETLRLAATLLRHSSEQYRGCLPTATLLSHDLPHPRQAICLGFATASILDRASPHGSQ